MTDTKAIKDWCDVFTKAIGNNDVCVNTFNTTFTEAIETMKRRADPPPETPLNQHEEWYALRALKEMVYFYENGDTIIQSMYGVAAFTWNTIRYINEFYREEPWVIWLLALRMGHLQESS